MRRLLVLLFALLAVAGAQQYFASGGFSKAELINSPDDGVLREVAGVYIAGNGETITLYTGPAGVYTATNPALDPVLFGEHNNVRDVFVGAGEDLSAVFIGRNRSNGRSHYILQSETSSTDLFNLGEQLTFHAVPGTAEHFYVVYPQVGGSVLTLITPDTTDVLEHEILRSDEMIGAVSMAPAADGGMHLLWLSGDTSRTAFGTIPDWTVWYQLVDAKTWEPRGPAMELGKGFVHHRFDRSIITAQDGALIALWPTEERTLSQAVLPAGAQLWTVTETSLAGRLLGATAEGAYWYEGTSIYRSELPLAKGAVAPPPVVASPVTIEGANLHAREIGGELHTAFAWYGRTLRGTPQVFRSDTFTPHETTFWDHVIATFGWNPWNYGEQFIGQFITAAIIAALGGLMLLMIVWFVQGVVLQRFLQRTNPQRVGEYVAAIVFLATMGLVSIVSTPGTWWRDFLFLLPITIGSGLLARLWRPGRRHEPFFISIISSYLVLFIAMTVWVFLTYPRWAPIFGLS